MMRKEKHLTQKELAEKLFVSNKAVSKWERGISMPNVALLSLIAEILQVTLEELLQGKRLSDESNMLIEKYPHRNHMQRKKWKIAYSVCALVTIIELTLGYHLKIKMEEVFLLSGLSLTIGGWFCMFIKDVLPTYYDENKINIFTQGICRLHMPGLSFNNTNWYYICNTLKIGTLLCAVLSPLLCLAIVYFFNPSTWLQIKEELVPVALLGILGSIYFVGKRYES